MSAPTSSADFDRVYRGWVTPWGDVRVPPELQALVRERAPSRALELGCGLGRFSRWLAAQGVATVGVDFSPEAVDRARARVASDPHPPDFRVADVTTLEGVEGAFDLSLDVGCFHCLGREGAGAYVAALASRLSQGAVHLMWTLDTGPSDLTYDAASVADTFAPHFELLRSEASRRRVVSSRWFWLGRR